MFELKSKTKIFLLAGYMQNQNTFVVISREKELIMRGKEQRIRMLFYSKLSKNKRCKGDRIRIMTLSRFSNDVKVKRLGPITDLNKSKKDKFFSKGYY